MSERKNTFFGGAAVLAVGAIVVKLIGALYKIPLANILGDTANGYFNSAYTIYSVLLTISTGGLPCALSKQISEAHALGRVNQKKRIFFVSLFALVACGLFSLFVMLFGAEFITANILGNPGAHCATMVLSPAALFVCCMSALRGYTQGQSIMTPTAISQILEAICKLVFGLSLAYAFLMLGSSMTDVFTPLELSASGAIAGVSIGTFVAFTFLVLDFIHRIKQSNEVGHDVPQPRHRVLIDLFKLAIPITLGASVVPIVNFLDTMQVQNRLQEVFQITSDAASALYGTYSAATNLYSLPSSLMVPFTASLVPAISAARARRDYLGATRITESAMRVAMLVACPMGFGLTSLATPIVTLLYGRKYDVSIMGPILAVLGIVSICTCIVVLSNSIMQASGYVNLPVIIMVIGGVLKLIVNYVLVGMESVGIQGAPYGTLACFGSAALLDLIMIHKTLPNKPNYRRIFFKPVLASLIMAFAAWASHGLLFRILDSNSIATVGAIVIAVLVYAILVVALRAISPDDLEMMPKGEKIAKLLRIR